MSILLIRTGNVLHCRDAQSKALEYGDTENTLGLLTYLGATHGCTFLGTLKGTPPPGVNYIELDLRGVNEWDGSAQFNCAQDALRRVPKDITICLDVTGPAWTRCWINNLDFTCVQAVAARYCGPVLYVINKLSVPRVLIVTDLRNYPRNFEMYKEFPNTVPVAVLSQEEIHKTFVLDGRRMEVKSCYGACENWFSYGQKIVPVLGGYGPPLAVAHSHFDSTSTPAPLRRQRDRAWAAIVESCPTLEINGRGWKEFSVYNPERHHFNYRKLDCWKELAGRIGGPMISPRDGFVSTKLRKYLRCGVCPFLWNGGELRYDDCYRGVPPNSALRFTDLQEAIEQPREVLLDSMRLAEEATRPDFSILETCLEATLPDFDQYGGYRSL